MSMLLPSELVVEIISWLPVKSLLRFKCVNKTWHSVISDPGFAKLQLSRSTDCHKLLVTTRPPQSVDFEALQVRNLNHPAILARDDYEKVRYSPIIGSCNGLICLRMNKRMFLWNPTTGNCSHIPNPCASFQGVVLDVFLKGMAYNRSTGDYGVICVSTLFASKCTLIEIYSLKTRSWERVEESGFPEPIILGSEFTWKGDLYCLSLSIKGGGYSVICFDMVEVKFKEVLPLPDTGSGGRIVNLGLCENSLCVFIQYYKGGLEALALKMEGNEKSFKRVFKDQSGTFRGRGTFGVCLTKSGQVVMENFGWDIHLYDPKLHRRNGSLVVHHGVPLTLYQETLVSPGSEIWCSYN